MLKFPNNTPGITLKEQVKQYKIIPLLETLRLEDIDDKIYFSAKYKDYISNSRMGLLLQEGAQAYFEGLAKHNKVTQSFAFGSAIHECTLQPESFFVCEDVACPTAKVGLIADLIWDKSKNGELPMDAVILDAAAKVDYYHGAPNANQMSKLKETIKTYFKERYKFEQDNTDDREIIYLSEKDRERYYEVMKSLESNTEIQKLLHPVNIVDEPLPNGNEKTILLDIKVEFPDHEPIILKLKAKLDNYTIDVENNKIIVNDIKTTGKLCKYFADFAVKDFHYNREIAFYSWLLSLCAKKYYNMENPKIEGNFLVVETIPSYWSTVVPMQKSWYKAGIEEFSNLIKLIAHYTINGYQ